MIHVSLFMCCNTSAGRSNLAFTSIKSPPCWNMSRTDKHLPSNQQNKIAELNRWRGRSLGATAKLAPRYIFKQKHPKRLNQDCGEMNFPFKQYSLSRAK